MSSRNFFDLFNLIKDKDYIKEPYIWGENSPDIGFAILKKYPKGKRFIPAQNNTGEDDNLILIKVFLQKAKQKDNKITIGLTISNVSFYKLDNKNIWYEDQFDYSNPLCPTKESVVKSKESTQPINLEEMDRFIYDISENKFYNTKNNKEIIAKNIIRFIYDQHIETISNTLTNGWLRFRISFNNILIYTVKWVGDIFIKIIPKLSGKKIENKYHNMFIEPFNWVNTGGVKDVDNQEIINYDDLLKKINYFVFSVITSLLIILYILKTYYCIDFLKIIDFLQKNKGDQIFSVVMITFVVLFFNYILPNFLLLILNTLILKYRKLSSKRFEL